MGLIQAILRFHILSTTKPIYTQQEMALLRELVSKTDLFAGVSAWWPLLGEH